MDIVPSTARLAVDLPPGVENVIDVLGASRLRVAILRHLGQRPGSTTTEIADAIGSLSYTVHKHLQQLEAAGAVITDTPPAIRNGRIVRFSLDVAVLDAAIADLRNGILPPTDK